jgi:hypothetical protein
MSKFKLVCEDDDVAGFGPFNLTQKFETEELSNILGNLTKFLHCCGYLSGNQIIEVGRDINLDAWLDDDLDAYTEKLFTGTPIPKE